MDTIYIQSVWGQGWTKYENIPIDEAMKIYRRIRKRKKNYKPAPYRLIIKSSYGDIMIDD